jgi:hypothetical protein
MTAHWIAIALDAAATFGKSVPPMSNIQFFLRAALLILTIASVTLTALKLGERN